MSDIQSEIISYDRDVRSHYSQVKEFIKNNPLPGIPNYDKIQTRQGLYESYGAVVEIANKVADLTSKVVEFSMIRITFKRLIKNEHLPPSVSSVYLKSIDEVNDIVGVCDRLLSTYKVAVDNQLRFYGSCQYILGSPRLSSMS